jgi:hypothetical protein
MNTSEEQFPKSLSGFAFRGTDVPDQQGFSDAALAGHKKTKFSSSVKVIEPRGGVISPISQEAYNKTSSDIAGVRKSGKLAKHDAEQRERKNQGSKKKVVRVDSNPAKGK